MERLLGLRRQGLHGGRTQLAAAAAAVEERLLLLLRCRYGRRLPRGRRHLPRQREVQGGAGGGRGRGHTDGQLSSRHLNNVCSFTHSYTLFLYTIEH